ncbi:hypothetical protein TU82_23510 [Pseudomonas orientalis]|nr:hypothetical protein TU82_23510 [Pseudomonas orientalis]
MSVFYAFTEAASLPQTVFNPMARDGIELLSQAVPAQLDALAIALLCMVHSHSHRDNFSALSKTWGVVIQCVQPSENL